MAVNNGTFIFEIFVEKINSLMKSPHSIIKSVFADVFSLELRYSKDTLASPRLLETSQKHVVNKSKSKIVARRKKIFNEPQSEQSNRSVQFATFSRTAEVLTQIMKTSPLALSLWSEKDKLVYVGSATIPWDAIFIDFLQKIYNCDDPPPVFLKENTTIFQEITGKLIAKIDLQLKLTYVTDKIPTGYLTLSKERNIRNGLNDTYSKTTSYLSTTKSNKHCQKKSGNCACEDQLSPYLTLCNDSNYLDNTGKSTTPYISIDTRPAYDSVIDCLKHLIAPCMDSMTSKPAHGQSKEIRSTGETADRIRFETTDGFSTRCPFFEADNQVLATERPCASRYIKNCDINKSAASRCDGQVCIREIPIEKVYVVYYFTVEYNFDKDPTSKTPSTNDPTSKESSRPPSSKVNSSKDGSSKAPSSKEASSVAPSSKVSFQSLESDKFAKFEHCPPTCPILKLAGNVPCSKSICGIQKLDMGDDTSDSKCTSPVCTNKQEFPPSPADSNIVIKFNDIYNPCCVRSCDISERVKEFISTNTVRNESRKKSREMEDATDPCYCDCVCTFKFSSKTTYCGICGGYECLGDDTKDLPDYVKPHPCPVYHKLYDKKYIKVKSPWPEEEEKKETSNPKLSKSTASKAAEKAVAAVKVTKTPEKEVKATKETTQETKTKKKVEKKKVAAVTPSQVQVEKKKFDVNKYAYPPVPKHMGWNWLAKDIPGMEPRAKWRPGAANKILVRRYRALLEGSDTIAKKKRAMMQRKKKIEMKPTLIVSKQNGEFTVQMEVFKKYSKERLLHQYPYDEKPPLIYTIGKTAAEQNKLQRQRDRRARRDSRRKSRLLQSTFRDKCQEICLKAYNQSIGLQPLPNPNDPDCPCATQAEPSISPAIDSCSCSDEVTISSSDTDHDEWIIEFTPPMANWDTKAKHPPTMETTDTQYNYLDYKVKLFDRLGNPIPRFFKNHEGKQECSDLGGFWGPGHVWLEINKDGYIGPDERWVPMNFFGPDGMSYSAEDGFFTDNTGQTLKLGVDGYIDKDLKWVWYTKKKQARNSITSADDPIKGAKTPDAHTKAKADSKSKATAVPVPLLVPPAADKGTADKGAGEKVVKTDKVVVTKGDKSAVEKGTKGEKGAGEKGTKIKSGDKKVVLDAAAKHSAPKKNHPDKSHNPVVMNVSVIRDKRPPRVQKDRRPYVDPKKMAKYREIMGGFHTYGNYVVKPQAKTNRASNTPRKKPVGLPQYCMLKDIDSITNATTSCCQTVKMTTSTLSSNCTFAQSCTFGRNSKCLDKYIC